MARRRGPQHAEQLNWPPEADDVKVMDLGLESSPAELSPRPPADPGPAAANHLDPSAWKRLGPPARNKALHWLSFQRAALLVLAVLALAQGVFIVARVTRDRGSAAVSPPASKAAPARAPLSTTPVATAPPATGYLVVRTQPPGATVSVDGKRLGTAPVTLPQLEAGEHEVLIQSRSQTIRHQVRVGPGEIVSLVIPLSATASAPPAASDGSLTVRSPVELRIFEGERLLGTSEMARVPLEAGKHTLRLTNDTLGYQQDHTVQISPGRPATLEVEMPKAPVAINALPWAEVWIDGSRVGATPLGALAVQLGTHDVVLRHPQLGEKTVRILVKANEPARISVDMRR